MKATGSMSSRRVAAILRRWAREEKHDLLVAADEVEERGGEGALEEFALRMDIYRSSADSFHKFNEEMQERWRAWAHVAFPVGARVRSTPKYEDWTNAGQESGTVRGYSVGPIGLPLIDVLLDYLVPGPTGIPTEASGLFYDDELEVVEYPARRRRTRGARGTMGGS